MLLVSVGQTAEFFCEEDVMFNRIKRSITLTGLSAGLMYLFDPDVGNRRRALLRDRFNHAINRLGRSMDVLARDLENRLYGTICELQQLVTGHDTTDEVISARVRSKLGRYTSHPRAIDVEVRDRQVSLSGPILADEVQDLVAAVKAVDGVRNVENNLDVYSSAENVSAVQGGVRPTGEPGEWMQENWSPTARLIAGSLGGMAMLNCAARRTLPAMLCGAGGFLLLVRAVSNQNLLGTSDGITGRPSASTRSKQQQEMRMGSNVPSGGRDRRTIGSDNEGTLSADQLIDEASDESFPASDTPSFTRR